MGRRSGHKYHAIDPKAEPRGTTSRYTDALCGDGLADLDMDQSAVTCPACAKKLGKAMLADVAGRITLRDATPEDQGRTAEAIEKYGSAYRSITIVAVDGVDRAAVVISNGWGTTWEIKRLKKLDRQFNGILGATINEMANTYENKPKLEGSPMRRLHKHGKDAAISIIPALTDGGLLPTVEEQAALEAKAKEARAAIDREWEEKKRKREEDRKHAEEAIRSLIEKTDLLTNYEAEGLALALKFVTRS